MDVDDDLWPNFDAHVYTFLRGEDMEYTFRNFINAIVLDRYFCLFPTEYRNQPVNASNNAISFRLVLMGINQATSSNESSWNKSFSVKYSGMFVNFCKFCKYGSRVWTQMKDTFLSSLHKVHGLFTAYCYNPDIQNLDFKAEIL